MIKKNLKIMIISSIVALLPIIAGVILWDKLPTKLPIHWDISGNVDGYASRALVVFLFPLILTAIHWLAIFVTSTDPKRQNHSDKMMIVVYWLVPALSIVISLACYATALGMDIMMNALVPVLMGVMFIVIGNYLPKCKQSHTVGIRLPWTLNSEENWNKTHRLGGYTMVVGGIVIFATAFIGIFWLFMVITAVMIIIPIAYSFVLYKRGI